MRHITDFLHNFASHKIANHPTNPTGQDHPSSIFTINPPITSPPVAIYKPMTLNEPITSPMLQPSTLKTPITSPGMVKGALTNLFASRGVNNG